MEESTISGQFKTMKIIFSAFIMGILVFSVVTIVTTENLFFKFDTDDIFGMIVPALSIIGILGNTFMFKNVLNTINSSDELSTKVSKYQTANLVRAALLEAPALLGIVATFTTGNYYFLLFSLLMVLAMVYVIPTIDKFKQAVQLSFEEKSKLNSI